MMNIIDLTHTLTASMPVYPGTEPPILTPANTIERDGFRETLLTLYSHTGTHMDAPAHLFDHGYTLDQFPAAQFAGKALVIDCSHLGDGEEIPVDLLAAAENPLDETEFLLLHTGRSVLWGSPAYFGSFPVLSMEACQWVSRRNFKGVGVDVISVDPLDSFDLPRHRILLETNRMVIIENLCNLDQLGSRPVTVCLLPLKTGQADGAPVRAIAWL